VITSGGSLATAIDVLKERKITKICMIVALLKRKYPGKRPIDKLGIPWECLFEEEEFY